MAQKYYNLAETAQVLGISEDEVKDMLGRQQLHGYRDGADWKFKVEAIDRLAQQRREEAAPKGVPEEGEGDALLSEVELGKSDSSTSGTVIGMQDDAKSAADTDLRITLDEAPRAAGRDDLGSKVAQFEELELTLDEDLTLEEGGLEAAADKPEGGSDIDFAGEESDDDQVLGGSTGSDITIGGDSGISLVDPTDSGLSLEEPLELGGSSAESLELGEDDTMARAEEPEAVTELKSDEPFVLTTSQEAVEDEPESGSQVIALDLDSEGDDRATMIGPGGGVAAVLDEDLGGKSADELDLGAALGVAPLRGQPRGLVEGAPAAQAAVALPETPYSVWNVLGLTVCTIVLVLCGMFMVDLLRNMWSWNTSYGFNSWLMDLIIG